MTSNKASGCEQMFVSGNTMAKKMPTSGIAAEVTRGLFHVICDTNESGRKSMTSVEFRPTMLTIDPERTSRLVEWRHG